MISTGLLFYKRYKRIILIIIAFIISPYIGIAQVEGIYEGQVINKETQIPVPSVSVLLLKQKMITLTNEHGYFRLFLDTLISTDTLVFSSIGYQTYRTPVSAYKRNMFILLQSTNTTLNEVKITNRKLKVVGLNKFDAADIKGTNFPFETRFAFAKLFTAPQANVILAGVELGKRDYDTEFKPLTTISPHTRFLIHVVKLNPKTGGPGDAIFTKSVTLDDNAVMVRIDLSKENIVIQETQFIIAVEWLKIPFNEIVQFQFAPKVRKINKKGNQLLEDVSQYMVRYQPILIAYGRKKAIPSWTKTKTNIWIPYNSSKVSTGTEIALSATIHY